MTGHSLQCPQSRLNPCRSAIVVYYHALNPTGGAVLPRERDQ